MSNNLEFDRLLNKYANFTEEERNAYLVYKSYFFNFINSMASVPDFMDLDDKLLEKIINKDIFDLCRKFGDVLNRKNNIIIKYSLFSDVDFNDNLSIIKFAKKVYKTIEKSFSKITLDNDLQVYRVVSVNDDNELDDLSKSNFISTTLDKRQTLNFIDENTKKIVFYKINLEAGTPVVISPYSIINEYDSLYDMVNNTDNYSIKIKKSESKGQQEILLSKDSLEYFINLERVQEIDGQQFYYYTVDTKVKTNKNYI